MFIPSKIRTQGARKVAGMVASICLMAAFAQTGWAQSYAISNLWTVAAGDASHPFLTPTGDNTRGLAYNPVTDHVLVVSRAGSNAVYILDSSTGVILGTLPFDTTLIQGGNFAVSMIDITPDGVIYVGNLTTDATGSNGPFKLYRWANETVQPTLAYSGDPSENSILTSGRRFGDCLAVRGTGKDTQILLGTYTPLIGLLRTTDGVNFTSTKIVTDLASQDSRWGLAWGSGNTFWAKQGTGNLKLVTLDLVANTGTVTASIPLPAGPGGPLSVDLTRNLLAILECSGTTDPTKHNLRLFDISNPNAPLQIDTTRSMPVANVNGNSVGSVSMRNGKLFALETNNGILGYYLQGGIYYPVAIKTQPGSVTLWEGAENWTFSAGLSGTPPFSYQWQRDEVDIAGATDATYTLPTADFSLEDGYRVIVSNYSAIVTSAQAFVTIQPGNASAQVSNIWDVAANSRPYLTSNYKEYGVAINPLTTNVIVVTRANPTNMIAVLDIETGAHKHYIDYSSLVLAGGNMNKVTVADDGTVFVCNLSTDATATPFTIYGFMDDSPNPVTGWLYSSDPGVDSLGNRVLAANIGWGANMDARGGGPSTELIIGAGKWSPTTYDANAVAILTYDSFMSQFISTPIVITNLAVGNNNFRFGLCWGPGESFWAKGLNGLMYIEFDRAAGVGGVKKIYPTGGSHSVPPSVTAMAFDSDSGLLAALQNGSPPTPVSVPFYDVSDTDAGPLWVDQELFTSYNADIEFQGSVSFEKGYAVALGVNNGLKAFKVNSGFVASLPVIVNHPASGTWFETTSPTISVVADSASPMTYQWYKETTELAGKTDASLTLANIQQSDAGDYWVRVSNTGGSRDSRPATLTVIPAYTTAQMTNIWSVLPGTRDYLNTGYFEYGMSFNPVNSNLLVASYVATNTPAVIIAVLDALTGAEKHRLDVGLVSGGNRWINKIGVADDGVVYAANRTTASVSDPLKIYRWADDQPSIVPSIAFTGDPFPAVHPNKLAGWTMDVRGAGVNTEILLSTSSSNVLSVLKTTDGLNFTANDFVVANAPADFARLGICFGAGNTFWVKTWLGSLYLVEYDLMAKTGTILRTYDTTQFPSTITTLAYNDSLKMLAGAARDDQKNIQLFSVANLDQAPVLLDQELFPTYNPSIEANGALDFGGNTYLFGMNENNGIIALFIDPDYVPPVTSFKILSATASAGAITLQWEAQDGASYQVQYADTVNGTWLDLGGPVIATGSTASYTDNPGAANIRFYRVMAK